MNEKTLMQIANVLSANVQNLNRNGLLKGKMGVVIFLYHYARNTGCKSYSDLASNLLDEIFIAGNNPSVSISNGLSGIGWGIHYLMKKQFISCNEDIFEEAEKWMVRSILGQQNEDMLDVGLYFACCRSSLLDKDLLSNLSNKVKNLLSNGRHSLDILNKIMALILRTTIQDSNDELLDALSYSIDAQLYRTSDLMICKDLLLETVQKYDMISGDKLYNRCESLLLAKDLQKDRLETVWQHLLFFDDFKKTVCDMDWTSSLVHTILLDLKEENLYLNGGLPAIGLDIILSSNYKNNQINDN